jgi:hypothetical protein
MESIFRNLILFTIILTIAGWVMPYIDYLWLSSNQIRLLNQGGFDAIIPGNDFIYWFTLVIWIAVSLGLYFYIKIAKPVFFIAWAASIVLMLFYGTQVITPVENLIFSLLTLTDGAIMAMLLFTSIREKFE